VHVDRDDCSAKFWLIPVGLSTNLGFSAVELARIERMVQSGRQAFLRRWHEYFEP